MRFVISCVFLMLANAGNLAADMMHKHSRINPEWKEENLASFNELILSWNANRPIERELLFYVSVKTCEWSPWLLYASWAGEDQSSFSNRDQKTHVSIFQDTLEVVDGYKADAFRIKVMAQSETDLNNVHSLHVYTNGNKNQELNSIDCLDSICLKMSGVSQMTVDHPRCADLCSPTSTVIATRYLSDKCEIDPASFACSVWDKGFDIFGNWVFNVAQASTYLSPQWDCWVERLNGFHEIYQRLTQGTPVVVSIRGPLPGSALPYKGGHLMVVVGYDALLKRVICLDPAFPSDKETFVSYELFDFTQAWKRRGNVAYIFSKR